MKGDDIAERMLAYSVAAVRIASRLPKNQIGKSFTSQLVRSASSGGANYEEARGSESRADFVHKLGLARKELRESLYWLKLINHTELADKKETECLCSEGNELVAILTKSMQTARSNQTSVIPGSSSVIRHSSQEEK